jgi:hypothetical protein
MGICRKRSGYSGVKKDNSNLNHDGYFEKRKKKKQGGNAWFFGAGLKFDLRFDGRGMIFDDDDDATLYTRLPFSSLFSFRSHVFFVSIITTTFFHHDDG